MTSYTNAHANPQGAGDGRPTALDIVRDESLKGQLVGKVMVVTGTSSGIGIETARGLAATGATLFLTARNPTKAKDALGGILEAGRVSLVLMDNASFASIQTAAAQILRESKDRVNVLVNNAGVMGVKQHTLSKDGHETHFATNHLGHFLLFQLLKPAILASSTPQYQSRVVNVASSAHRACNLAESGNYDFPKGGYRDNLAYANSKLANVYMANELERRYGHMGLHATSVHPGAINTDISRHMDAEFVKQIMSNDTILKILKSSQQGAATTLVAAVGKGWEGKGGKYLEDCREAQRGEDDYDVFGVGFVSQTYDPADEKRLWMDSLQMLGMEDDGM